MDFGDEYRERSDTGGEKGTKPLQVSAVDPVARAELGRVAAYGAEKYDRHNYLKGYRWALSLDAMHRHTLAYEMGEDFDPETGYHHMAHAAWHALALVSFTLRGIGTDDRLAYHAPDEPAQEPAPAQDERDTLGPVTPQEVAELLERVGELFDALAAESTPEVKEPGTPSGNPVRSDGHPSGDSVAGSGEGDTGRLVGPVRHVVEHVGTRADGEPVDDDEGDTGGGQSVVTPDGDSTREFRRGREQQGDTDTDGPRHRQQKLRFDVVGDQGEQPVDDLGDH